MIPKYGIHSRSIYRFWFLEIKSISFLSVKSILISGMSNLEPLDKHRASLRILYYLLKEDISKYEQIKLLDYFNEKSITKSEFYRTNKDLKTMKLTVDSMSDWPVTIFTFLTNKGKLIAKLIKIIKEVLDFPDEDEHGLYYYNNFKLMLLNDDIDRLFRYVRNVRFSKDLMEEHPLRDKLTYDKDKYEQYKKELAELEKKLSAKYDFIQAYKKVGGNDDVEQ